MVEGGPDFVLLAGWTGRIVVYIPPGRCSMLADRNRVRTKCIFILAHCAS